MPIGVHSCGKGWIDGTMDLVGGVGRGLDWLGDGVSEVSHQKVGVVP